MEDQKHVDPLADTMPDAAASAPAAITTTDVPATESAPAPAVTIDNAEAVAPQAPAEDPAVVPAPNETAPSAVVAAAMDAAAEVVEDDAVAPATTAFAGVGDEKRESAPEGDIKEITNTELKEISPLNTNAVPNVNTKSLTNAVPNLNTNSLTNSVTNSIPTINAKVPTINTDSVTNSIPNLNADSVASAIPTIPSIPTLSTNIGATHVVNEQLEALKRTVEQKRAELREKEQQLAEHEATQELLKEVQIRHQSICKEVTELDKKKAQTVPEYESVKMNAYLRDDAAKLRADIEDHLAKVETANAEAAELEAELSETSKQYKEETTKRNAFLKYVTDSIIALQTAIAKKIAVTSGDGSTVDAADGLELLADTVRTRERQLASLEKEANEHKHICENDDIAIRELEQSSTTNVKRLREQKDEAIREAVFSFQDERAKLHTDIEDMKKINKEQSEQLKVGERRKLVEKGGFGKKSTSDPTPQLEQEAMNQRAEEIRQRNDELREEINVIRDEIKKATTTKAEAIRESKQLGLRIKKEKEAHSMTIAKLENDIQGTKLATARVEKENDKLALTVKQMTEHVKALKEASDSNVSRTKPLPVE